MLNTLEQVRVKYTVGMKMLLNKRVYLTKAICDLLEKNIRLCTAGIDTNYRVNGIYTYRYGKYIFVTWLEIKLQNVLQMERLI